MIAEFNIDVEAMRTAFESTTHVDGSIIQQTASETDGLDVVVNVSSSEFEAFETGLEGDDTVGDWKRFSDDSDCRRYRVTLTPGGREAMTYPQWSADGAVFLEGTRRRGDWRFQIQFPSEASLQRYVTYCENRDIDFQPIRLCRSDSVSASERFGLTSVQTRTLVNASERGFFQIPRDCTLEEMAADSEITHQALSERLRRGLGSLVESTLR
jgi:hypothetical protein